MAQITSHSRSTNAISTRTILSEQKIVTKSSANLIRARSSTLHVYNSTNTSSTEVRTSLLDHSESEMSSSMHVTKTPNLLEPPPNNFEFKQKSSSWLWGRRYTSKSSLVRSASTNKANEGDIRWTSNGDSDRPLGDETYDDSKTSTLSSAITIDGVAYAVKTKPASRSASTRDAKHSGGFLRFLRASFASRPKRSPEVKSGTSPLSMTQSGLASLAGKQANIARIFADPNSRLSTHISQFPNGSKTYNSNESFDSEASRESLSASEDNGRSSIYYSNEKPPVVANRNSVRSQSAHSRPLKPHSALLTTTNGWQGLNNIYSNGLDECTSIEIIRQPSILNGMNNNANTQQGVIYTPVTFTQPSPVNGYYANAFQDNFQMTTPAYSPTPNSPHYFQAYVPQSHFNTSYSDGQIYDQPPPPTPAEMNVQFTQNGNHHQQSSHTHYEGISSRMIPPIPPATAPASRKRFGRSNYESGDLSVDYTDEDDEDAENGKGGTLSRRRPAPPMGVLVNQYSRESLQFNDAHEKTPVPRGGTPARTTVPSQPVPNLPQPASRAKLMRRQTVGPVHSPEPNPVNPELFQGSLHLKRVVRPDLEQERHRDTSLRITIHESKNLSPSKRYFCDVCLDRKLYARTTSKLSKETVFWGECFDLNNLTELNFITINLYREADSTKESSKRRKSSKAQNQLVAFLTIAISDLSPKYETQQWHIMTPASMLPSSDTPQSNATAPRSSVRQSVGSFNSQDPVQTSPEAFAAASSTKRSISLVSPPPTSLLAGRIRKLSKQTMSGSEQKMNAGASNAGSNGSSGSGNVTLPQIRLAVKYQSIDVLPLHCYGDLRNLIVERSTEFVQFLEPILSTKKKEEIARCLVNIHEKAPESNIAAFLAPLVDQELDAYENLSLLFRSNSICSKAVECYIKLVGAEYLQKLLRGFIENLLTSTEDLEVDPSRLNGISTSPGSDSGNSSGSTEADISLHRNQIALIGSVKIVWERLQASLSYFPSDLRKSLASIRRTVQQRHGQEVADQIISGCLFLRYICPAIHGPTLFGLTNAVPDDPRVSRNLTLLAKVLQTIANFSHFEAKENYMRFLNSFVQSMQEEMHQFLRAVSTIEEKDNSGIWKRQMTNVSNCHNNIDLGYELTILYRQIKGILEENPKVPDSLAELPGILASIGQMLSAPSLRRSFSNLGSSMRAVTSASLEDTMNIRVGTLRFLSTVNSPTLKDLQITLAEQPATPVSNCTSGSKFTPKRVSSAGLQNRSCEIGSPGSESISQQQEFFGDSFDPGFEDSRGTDLASISETEVIAPPSDAKNSTSPITSFPTTENTSISYPKHHRSNSAQRHRISIGSSSLQRCKEADNSGMTSGSPTTNTLPTPPPHKWSSGPELNADSPVVLNFPPPPPSLPQQQKEVGGLGGSSTNIRMGTRAIRMSRERDLSGHHENAPSIRNSDENQESIQLSTVPVILQCETPATLNYRKCVDGSILSVDSAASYESSSSSCLSMMPQANNSTTRINGGGQSVFVAENAHYFELPADRVSPAMTQHGCRIPNTSTNAANASNNNDQALLNRVHSLLFGGSGNRNEYQNVRGMVRPVTSTTVANSAKISKNPEPQVSETSQLEVLQQKLKAMEENLNQERQDIQKAVASNMRIMESQERCISELIEEINRLQSLRSSNSGNPKANANSDRSNDQKSSSPSVSQGQ